MRYTYLASCFALTSGAAAIFDPCYFVGFRIAKAYSTCVESLCSNLLFDEATGRIMISSGGQTSEGLHPVSYSQAKQIRARIFSSSLDGERKRKRQDMVDPTLQDIRTEINPSIRALLYMDQPCAVKEAMARVDSNILKMSFESESWGSNRRALLSSPEMTELAHLLKLLIHKSITSPASYDMATGITAPFLHFMYDLLSLLPLEVMDARERAVIYKVVVRFSPFHREPYIGEFPVHSRMPFVDIARTIDDLADPRRAWKMGNVMDIIFDYNRLSFEDSLAARLILQHETRRVVCDQLVGFSRIEIPTYATPLFVKTIVSAIDLCKAKLPLVHRLEASLNVAEKRGTAFLPSSVDFDDSSLPWIMGFYPAVHISPASRAEAAVREYMTSMIHLQAFSEFDSREELERAMTSFGRALGLVVRYNRGRLAEILDIPPVIFRELSDKPLVRQTPEAIFFIHRGMQDVLGPAGIHIFTSDEWMSMHPLS